VVLIVGIHGQLHKEALDSSISKYPPTVYIYAGFLLRVINNFSHIFPALAPYPSPTANGLNNPTDHINLSTWSTLPTRLFLLLVVLSNLPTLCAWLFLSLAVVVDY
jgi:hypothetical protein